MEVTVNLSRAPNVQISPACPCLRTRSSHGPLIPASFSSNHPDRRPLPPLPGCPHRPRLPPSPLLSTVAMDSNNNGSSSSIKKHEDGDASDSKGTPKGDVKPVVRTLNRVPRTSCP